MITGKSITFGNNVDTDQIIPAQYLTLPSLSSMAPYAFDNHPVFKENLCRGAIIVAGENFGCGSSREQAPAVLKELGIGAVVAKSFARIFYRNGINRGIPLIECAMTDRIALLDVLEFDGRQLVNVSRDEIYPVQSYPPFIQKIFDHGGIVSLLTGR